ncbi:MAG: hypothetical protein P1P89_02200 [Desulfobacterales bacterium]|nr:hypothetical protein [Desulfobacterales bacterium]
MIKRETIKQAIDEIAARDPEIGYALDEMLGMGMIDAPAPGQESTLGDDFYFFFDGEKARVSRFLYINKGSVPIEERLLIKYGELLKTQELLEKGTSMNYLEAAGEMRLAGLRLLLNHEIDYAIERIKKQLVRLGEPFQTTGEVQDFTNNPLEYIYSGKTVAEQKRRLIFFLNALKQDRQLPKISKNETDPAVLYHGTVAADIPAFFVRFPFCPESFLQIADINIEFFHVRFFLNRLIQNQWRHLYACVVKNKIVGLLYLTFKEQFFHKNLEIKFIATARATSVDEITKATPSIRGVGTFLVAGAWLQWKTRLAEAREILLDSEIGARRFYDAMGFVSRGMSEFILGTPRGYLLNAIVMLANSSPNMDPQIYREIGKILQKQVKSLRRRPKTEKDTSERSAIIEAAGEFLKVEAATESGEELLRLFHKYRKKIPESDEFLRIYSAERTQEREENTERAAGSHH